MTPFEVLPGMVILSIASGRTSIYSYGKWPNRKIGIVLPAINVGGSFQFANCKRLPEDIFPLNPIKPPLNHHFVH
jgi:hypothetical protein